MLRLNKLTDYALVVMQYVASHPREPLHTTRELAKATHLPATTVVKILKLLLDSDLLISQRGMNGGYTLARPASQISIAEIVEAVEGAMGFTECQTSPGRCDLEGRCRIQVNTRIISQMIRQTFSAISLADFTTLRSVVVKSPKRTSLITSITMHPGAVQ